LRIFFGESQNDKEEEIGKKHERKNDWNSGASEEVKRTKTENRIEYKNIKSKQSV